MKKTGDINETGKNSVNITGGKVKGDIVVRYGLDEEAVKAVIDNTVEELSQKLQGVEKNNEALIDGVQNELFKQIFELKKGQNDLREAVRKNFGDLEANQTKFASQIMETINGSNPSGSMENALQSFREQSERAANAQYERFMAWQRELIETRRRELFEVTHEENIQEKLVLFYARKLLELVPDDVLARFYLLVSENNAQAVNAYLDDMDVVLQGKETVCAVLDYLIEPLEPRMEPSLRALTERALQEGVFRRGEYLRYITAIEGGKSFDPLQQWGLFVAFSSKDRREVDQLVKELEEQEINCFVAYRDLPHGRGAGGERYWNDLKCAMRNSRGLVFVSTPNSRSRTCDAIEREDKSVDEGMGEIPYYGKNFSREEKLRIEYRPESDINTPTPRSVEQMLKRFFGDVNYCQTPEEVVEVASRYLFPQLYGDGEGPSAAERKKEEQRKAEAGKAEEQRKVTEAAAEAAAEAALLAEARRKAQAARKAEKQRKEVARLAAERRKAEEAALLAEARRKKAEEKARKAEEAKSAKQRRIEEAKKAKQRRKEEKEGAKYRRQAAFSRGVEHVGDFFKGVGYYLFYTPAVFLARGMKHVGSFLKKAAYYLFCAPVVLLARGIKNVGNFLKESSYLLLYTLVVLLLIGSGIVFILELVGTLSTSFAAINMVKTTFYVSIGFLVIDAVIVLFFPGKNRRSAFTNVLKIAAALLGIATIVMGWFTVSKGRLSLDTKSSFYDEQYGVLYVELDTGFTAWEIAPGAEDVLILSEHDGLPVTGVHENAARNNSRIKTLTFTPQGNYDLGKAAFKGCPSLTTVSFGEDSRFTVHEDVFAGCKRLSTVDCGSNSTLTFERSNSFEKNNSFEGCLALSEFRINNSKLIVNTVLDIDCNNMLFGGETNAVIYVSGGETSYISDNVGGAIVGKDSSVVVVHYGDNLPVHVGTYRFEEGFDFDGSTLFTAELVNWVFVQDVDYLALADEIYLPTSVTYIPDNFFGDKGDGCTVYYAGSAEDWSRLSIGNSGNDNYNNGKVKIVYDYVG